MCELISVLLTIDAAYTPPPNSLDHSHEAIAASAGIPPGMFGDKAARVEVKPKNGEWRHPKTNAVISIDECIVYLDERRAPGWWTDDRPACEDRARRAAERWLAATDHRLMPGAKIAAGDSATIVAGDFSTIEAGNDSRIVAGEGSKIVAGNDSTIAAGNYSKVEAGYGSTIKAGDYSKVEAGDCSTATMGDYSAVTMGVGSTAKMGVGSSCSCRVWDGVRRRIHTVYVGENGIKANTPYTYRDGAVREVTA